MLRKFFVLLNKKAKKPTHLLEVEELMEAEMAIVRFEQNRAFVIEREALTNSGRVSKSSTIYRLDPYLDNQGMV